jgi:hypothetical protein
LKACCYQVEQLVGAVDLDVNPQHADARVALEFRRQVQPVLLRRNQRRRAR